MVFQVWHNDKFIGNLFAASVAAARKKAGTLYGRGCVVYRDR